MITGGYRAVPDVRDKLAVRYQATLHIAAVNEWLPRSRTATQASIASQ